MHAFGDSSGITRQNTVHKHCPFVVCGFTDTWKSLLGFGGHCHFLASAGFLKEDKLSFISICAFGDYDLVSLPDNLHKIRTFGNEPPGGGQDVLIIDT